MRRELRIEPAAVVALLMLCAVESRAQCIFAWSGDSLSEIDGSVRAFLVWDPDAAGPLPSVLVVGGGFTRIAGIDANAVAAWDGASWTAMGGDTLANAVTDLAVFRGKLYCAADALYEWSGSEWVWQPSAPVAIENLLVFGDDLIVGGCFPGCIRRWDGATSHELGEGMADGYLGDDACVNALAIYNGELIAGGNFQEADGHGVDPVVRWDGIAWHELAGAPRPSVRVLEVFNGKPFAGGLNRTPWNSPFARWTGATWSSIVGIEGPLSGVSALRPYRGQLTVAGSFDEPSGSIVFWDGQGFSTLGGGIDDALGVFARAEFDGDLIVGGRFDTVDGMAISNFAIWEAALVGDANDDKLVDLADLGLVFAAYATCPGDAGYDPAAGAVSDDGDACVTLADLGVVLAAWGANCDPPPPAISVEPVAR